MSEHELRNQIYQLAQDANLRPLLLPLVTPAPPSPVRFRHQHAFVAAVAIVNGGGFDANEETWFASIGFPGETADRRLTFTSFGGHLGRSGFTDNGNFWLEGTMVCAVTVRDTWGRSLTGTFTNPKFGHLFEDDGTYPSIFTYKPA